MHTCACFMHIYGCFHRICCLTRPHTSIQKGIHKGGGGAKKNNIEKVAPKKVKKNNVDKEGPPSPRPPARPSGGSGGRSPPGKRKRGCI